MALLVKIIRTNNQIMMKGLGEKAGTNVLFLCELKCQNMT